MSGELMLYGALLAALLGVAGLALERFSSWALRPRRWVWALCLALSLLIPLGRALAPPPPPIPGLQFMATVDAVLAPARGAADMRTVGTPGAHAPGAAAPGAVHAAVPGRTATQWLEAALLPAWIAGSSGLLLLYGALWLRLRLEARHWCSLDIEGQRVWITASLGPAVLGCLWPRILLPAWFSETSESTQAFILAHERAHIEARDPWLLLLGLFAVAAAPWNLPLWWQLHRLRFAIEVDCDARVLARRNEPRAYAETLLLVAQRRGRATAPMFAIALTEPASQLLRRIDILAAPTRRRSRMLLAGAMALGAACIAGAAALQTPATLAPQSLRKLPYDPMVPPHYVQAEAAARARFPELFKDHFDGEVEIVVALDRQGRVLDVERRAYSPPEKAVAFVIPPWFASSWAHAHGFELQDVMEHYERLYTWHGPQNADKLYLTYDVIKWPHDPTRSAERVRAAVLARYSQLTEPAPTAVAGHRVDDRFVTVVMNDNGTINQARFGNHPLRLNERFQAMGFDPQQLVHRGVIGRWQTQTAPYTVVYAWPRRPQDPPDEPLGLGFWQLFDLYPRNPSDSNATRMERERNTVDRALVQRYFPEFWQHGATRSDEWLWLLLDRSGRVFAAGTADAPDDLNAIQTALFPGVTVGAVGYSYGYGYQVDPLHGRSAMLMFGWLGPDSAITSPSQVDPSKRTELLVMTGIRRGGQPIAGFPLALDFGIPTEHIVIPGVRLTVEADAAHGGAVDMHLRLLTSQDHPSSAVASGAPRAADAIAPRAAAYPGAAPGPSLRVMPEQQAALQFSDAQGQSWRIALRVARLAGLLTYPIR